MKGHRWSRSEDELAVARETPIVVSLHIGGISNGFGCITNTNQSTILLEHALIYQRTRCNDDGFCDRAKYRIRAHEIRISPRVRQCLLVHTFMRHNWPELRHHVGSRRIYPTRNWVTQHEYGSGCECRTIDHDIEADPRKYRQKFCLPVWPTVHGVDFADLRSYPFVGDSPKLLNRSRRITENTCHLPNGIPNGCTRPHPRPNGQRRTTTGCEVHRITIGDRVPIRIDIQRYPIRNQLYYLRAGKIKTHRVGPKAAARTRVQRVEPLDFPVGSLEDKSRIERIALRIEQVGAVSGAKRVCRLRTIRVNIVDFEMADALISCPPHPTVRIEWKSRCAAHCRRPDPGIDIVL